MKKKRRYFSRSAWMEKESKIVRGCLNWLILDVFKPSTFRMFR